MSHGKCFVISLLLLFATLWAGCDSGASPFFFGDSEESVDLSCTPGQHAECDRSGGNWLCSVDGECIEIGDCTSDEQCRSWRTDATRAECILGICSWSGGVVPADEDDTESDFADENADSDPESLLGCSDWKRIYRGDLCGQDVRLYIDLDEDCEGVVSIPELIASGEADSSGHLQFSNGCTGQRVPGGVNLTCGDCQTYLSPLQSSHDGRLIASSEKLDFGSVPFENSLFKTLYLHVENGSVEILSWKVVSEADYKLYEASDSDLPVLIEENDSFGLNVIYTNSRQPCTEETGVLWIYTSSFETPVLAIDLTARDYSANCYELNVEPTILDFGTLSSASPVEREFSVTTQRRNSGGFLTVVSVEFVPVPNSEDLENAGGAFRLVPFTASNQPPKDVEYNQPLTYTVRCQPIASLHQPNDILTGRVRVTYIYGFEPVAMELVVDLVAQVEAFRPACIDINPDEGIPNVWSEVEPGPGIDFGVRTVGETVTRTLEIVNCGDETLAVSGILYNGSVMPSVPNPFLVGITGSFEVPPRQTKEIPVKFYPTEDDPTELTAKYMVQSNAVEAEGIEPKRLGNCFTDSDCDVFEQYCTCEEQTCACVDVENVEFGLRGRGGSREIRIEPSEIDCGAIGVGCSSVEYDVTVFSMGSLPFTIENIGFGNEQTPNFSLYGLPQLPLTLSENASPDNATFHVICHPQDVGNHEATIQVVSNQGADHHDIGVVAEGISGRSRMDRFVVPEVPMVDMLWVIDSSGSMSEEQSALATNSEAFIRQAVQSGADVQIAVTTMGIDEGGGALVGDPGILRFGAPDNSGMTENDVIEAFRDNVQMTIGAGSGTERGLDAAISALGVPRPGENQEPFLRESAVLSVVFVSDEDDQSIGDVGFYVDYFKSLKGARDVEMMQFFAIVGDGHPNGGCGDPQSGSSATAGDRYIEVADQCNTHPGSHFMSICEDDWSEVFQNIGDVLFSFTYVHLRLYFLGQVPVTGTLAILVDGAGWNPDWWSYDASNNAIRFEQGHHPEPGSTVLVSYQADSCSR